MSTNAAWRTEFGLPETGGDSFFSSKNDLAPASIAPSQAHVVRRAFDLLGLDGVLCSQRAPIVYFKQVNRIDRAQVSRLHKKFWNHGGAPVLVLISPLEVHVYSALVKPKEPLDGEPLAGLVETLDRVSNGTRALLISVESGEYFRRHQSSFNPSQRVDRDLLNNLQATRELLLKVGTGTLSSDVLDALLCRLVFACYLFDRGVVGEHYLADLEMGDATHLRDILAIKPRTQAKNALYALFRKLGKDFNGDLFSDNLDAEERVVATSYLEPLEEFFRATNVVSGQAAFWPYDFSAIPVEVISAIYERFLKNVDRSQGAVYTPRFLAELVLDIALAGTPSLLGRRYLDPAAGSGIFLVGLFNRLAEEWKRKNPEARNDKRARELRKILCQSLCAIDINPTACRITAFSLYLAYLDQLSPRDIQELQQKGHMLPRLVRQAGQDSNEVEGNIWCGDFFSENADYPIGVDLVIGNPPWGSTAFEDKAVGQWCATQEPPLRIPDKQIAAAFVWKAPRHAATAGRVCLVLPHGMLFNHGNKALTFQRRVFSTYSVDHILNLVDFQFFLFEEAQHPAVVLSYSNERPDAETQTIEYWAPKTDWLVTRADVITVLPEDRSSIKLKSVLEDLAKEDAPQIWKQHMWATPRDRRLLDRLSSFPRLRDVVGSKKANKRWLIAEGFQPFGKGDDRDKAQVLRLPSRDFIKATSRGLNLLLLPDDCNERPSNEVLVRDKSNKETQIFRSPHVLVAQGFKRIAYADFPVSFQHALRGISGPPEDRELLVFLAAYLRSSLARYFVFQTSSNWGVSRQKVHVEELLRLPFLLPEDHPRPARAAKIVEEVSASVMSLSKDLSEPLADREFLVRAVENSIEELVDEYFDLIPSERLLVTDTMDLAIPSVRPTRKRNQVPTLNPSSAEYLGRYTERLCDTLNSWSRGGRDVVSGTNIGSPRLGIALAVLTKSNGKEAPPTDSPGTELLEALDRLRASSTQSLNLLSLPRAVKLFDRNKLYIVKPIGQRFWSESAALNDADEIAASILLQPGRAAS